MNIEIIGNGNIASKNFNTSFLINNNILVEAPPGISKELKRLNKDINDINIILITHLHGDHYFDLPFIILNEYSRKRERPLFIIGPKDLKKELNKLMKLAFKNPLSKYIKNLDIIFIDAINVQNKEVSDNIFISSINVVHGELSNTYGYILKKDNKFLGITGDIEICPGLSYILKKVDYCLIDVNNQGSHLKLNDLKELIKEYPVKYIPVHFPDEIEDELRKLNNVKVIKPEEQFFI